MASKYGHSIKEILGDFEGEVVLSDKVSASQNATSSSLLELQHAASTLSSGFSQNETFSVPPPPPSSHSKPTFTLSSDTFAPINAQHQSAQSAEVQPANYGALPRNFTCGLCQKAFARFKYLQDHYYHVHRQMATFKCTACTKQFKRKSELARHSLIHTGERPFPCEDCGKSFRQKFALKRHKMIHTGEKPATCSLCGRSFNQRGNMKTHSMKCKGVEPSD